MGTTKLKLFREALRELGQQTITDTGDADPGPRALAEAYDDAVEYCLRQGYWNFALATTTLATQGGTAMFGYTYPYPKPSDWVRTVRISEENSFWPPAHDYEDARNEIHSNTTPLYLVYVSNATDAGLSLAEWPDTFAAYVSCEMARRICNRIGGSTVPYEEIDARCKQYLVSSLLKDSLDGGTLVKQADLIVASEGGGPEPQ